MLGDCVFVNKIVGELDAMCRFCFYVMWVSKITISGDFLQTPQATKTVQPVSANYNNLETLYINKCQIYHRKISKTGHLLITPKIPLLIKICSTQNVLTRRSQRNTKMQTLPTQHICLWHKRLHFNNHWTTGYQASYYHPYRIVL